MKAELIAVGTELLLGQIVNSNAQYLSRQCAAIGVDVYFQTVVGDNPDRLKQALAIAESRAELIICTGGLGPTLDDLTKDVLAERLGRALVVDQPAMDKMTKFFAERNVVMVASNTRQAMTLEGSVSLTNDTGLAIGTAVTQDGKSYILLPGPPKEMIPMFRDYALPWIRSIMTDELPLFSKMLKFAGIGESNLEHALLDLIQEQTDPTIAPYAKEGEVTIRLTSRAATEDEAFSKMEPVKAKIVSRVGEYLYAEEDVTIEEVIFRKLKDNKKTLAVAESCTGGLLSDLLTAIPGSSTVFKGGVVSYSNELKAAFLGVPAELLEGVEAPGAVSSETALAMAQGLLERAETDYAVSITGVAGPDPSEGKPVGLVYFGVASMNAQAEVIEARFNGSRETIKLKAAKSALYYLWKQLKA
ncbi:competence/damage-inducible protein A [Gorillibacterium timonense]|uniref:competence/damage-inducible protein A n=1 Tax=Gorillibacterium timonense TaxID=1689269 RepID=UPI00071C3150|nr:competence/damage-inducible protein A [Gorillibacterium timonense]